MWIFFSILAAFTWAVVNIIDKYVLTKWVKESLIPVIVVGIFGFISSLAVYLLRGFSSLSGINILLALIAGIFYTLMVIFYFKALELEEVSRIVPLFYLSPLFILFLAWIFLNETFTPIKYFGVFLLAMGAILISSKDLFKIKFGKAFWLMMLSTFSVAINAVLTKYILKFTDFWTIFAYERIGALFPVIPIIYFYFSEFINTTKRYGKRVAVTISVSGILDLLAVIFITIATSLGSVTLVDALSSIQSFFVLFLASIFSIFYPQILKEEVSKRTLFLKSTAIVFMFIGVILIT